MSRSLSIGEKFPEFEKKAVLSIEAGNEFGTIDHESHRKSGRWMVMFWWPKDFTFVCPSEIIAFHNRIEEFNSRNTKVVGVSVDSHFSHLAWKNTKINNGGIGQVQYPLVADLTKNIARDYDVLTNESVALRGTFLIDQDFTVRHQIVNDLPLGRNIEEAIRIVDSLIFFQENGEVCPAGWNKGKEGMKPDSKGVASYLEKNAEAL